MCERIANIGDNMQSLLKCLVPALVAFAVPIPAVAGMKSIWWVLPPAPLASPVTVKSGNMGSGGIILSAPVAFADTARATEDQKMGPYNVEKESLWFRERFFGADKQGVGTPNFMVSIRPTFSSALESVLTAIPTSISVRRR